MRILLSEKQFNLIILSEGRIPTKMGEVHKTTLLSQYTPEQLRDEIRYYINKGEFKTKNDVSNKKGHSTLRNRIDYFLKEKNLDILGEFFKDNRGSKPKTPEQIKSDFYNILNYYKEQYKTGEKITTKIKNEKNEDIDNPKYGFLKDYKYDFSGKIMGKKDKNTTNLLRRFYEEVGYTDKPEIRVNEIYTKERIKEKFEELVNFYNKLWEDKKVFIGIKNEDGKTNNDYEFLRRYDFSGRITGEKDENIKNLLYYFYIATDHEIKQKKIIEIKFDNIVNQIKAGGGVVDITDMPKEYSFLGNYNYDFSSRAIKKDPKTLLSRFYEMVGKSESEYKGEKYIAKYLESKNLVEDVDFFRGKRCEMDGNCSYPDFYLPEYKKHKIIIEFDGRQHFEHVQFSGKDTYETMEKRLKDSQNRDRLKNEYCQEKGINLYRIKHNYKKSVSEESVNEIMDKIFNDIKSGSFNLTYDKFGYIETPESKKYESKMNTNPMANLDETIYRILNNIKKQYIY